MKHHRLISKRPLLAQTDTTGGTTGTTTGTDTSTSIDTSTTVGQLKNFLVNSTDQIIQWVFLKTM